MHKKLQRLIDQLPTVTSRSKLEPYFDVICELRRKHRSYRQIAVFLREHLHLTVASSTIHSFVKSRADFHLCQGREPVDTLDAEPNTVRSTSTLR